MRMFGAWLCAVILSMGAACAGEKKDILLEPPLTWSVNSIRKAAEQEYPDIKEAQNWILIHIYLFSLSFSFREDVSSRGAKLRRRTNSGNISAKQYKFLMRIL